MSPTTEEAADMIERPRHDIATDLDEDLVLDGAAEVVEAASIEGLLASASSWRSPATEIEEEP